MPEKKTETEEDARRWKAVAQAFENTTLAMRKEIERLTEERDEWREAYYKLEKEIPRSIGD